MAEYRKARLERDPGWYAHLAQLQANWREQNRERKNAQARASYARKKAWEASGIRGF